MAGVVYAAYTMEEIYAEREDLVSSIAGERPGTETTFSGEQNVEINGRNGINVVYSFSQSGQVYANLYLVFIPGTNADSYTVFFMIPVEMEYDEGLTSDVETMTTSFTITG